MKEGELDVNSVIKNYLTTATDGKPYDKRRKAYEAELADQLDLKFLENLAKQIKKD